ncbi:MAG TPA: radical SAM protein [Coriobacteriia bacterium]
MADDTGNADARPDLEMEIVFGEDGGALTEAELTAAEAPCGAEGVAVPIRHPSGHPGGHPGGHPAGVPMERQRHGGARSVGFRPGGGEAALAYQERTGIKAPRIIAWEITRSCNLSCAHCRAAAEFGHYAGELSLDQIKATIDDIVTITNPIIILTGGEPLMRPDIWEIVDYAQDKGAMPVIGTNATLITDEIAAKMAAHGIPRISVSVDFPTAEEHDAFRGQVGCFDKTIEGIRIAKRHGVGVQINMTVTTLNADKVEAVHDLALSLGIDAFHIFMLVPTGRGSDLLDKELPPAEYERVLAWAYERQKTSPLHFKPTDAPHYYRIIRQLAKAEGKKVTREEYGLDAMTRGCLGGITFCFISHVGDIQPCGYFDMQLGNVKTQAFSTIWTESKVLGELRDYSLLKGKCGICEYKAVCGGCRARALSVTGDYLAAEPYCVYEPASSAGTAGDEPASS